MSLLAALPQAMFAGQAGPALTRTNPYKAEDKGIEAMFQVPRIQQIADVLGSVGRIWSGNPDPGPSQAQQQQMMRARLMLERMQGQRQRQEGREDKMWEWQNKPADTGNPYRWEDNAGNVWERGPDGQNQRIFTDAVPKFYVQGDQAIRIPNPYAGQGAQGGQPPVRVNSPDEARRLPPGTTFVDPNGVTRTVPQAAAQNSGPVATNGMEITAEMWRGAVDSLGREGAEAWKRRNNIRIRGR